MENKVENMRVFSQVVAVMVKNLLMLSIGMSVGYVGIIIPALTDPNSKESIYMDEAQTSWTSAIIPLASLIGSAFSGSITEPLGRRGSMIILTVPCVISWISYYLAEESWQIFATLILHGFTNGLVKAPVLIYVAEVTEPRLRGLLASTTLLSTSIGIFLAFLIGSLLHWRIAALVSCTVPLISVCLLSRLPETPYWLLAQNKPEEARRSLAWLRGWTSEVKVEQEFQQIQKNVQMHPAGVDNPAFEDDSGRVIPLTKFINAARPTVKDLAKRSFLRPFSLMAFLFIWSNFIGVGTTQIYSVVIFSTFKAPVNKYYASVLMSSARVLASILCIFIVRLYGKRRTAMVSSFALCLCSMCIGIYAYLCDVTQLNFTSDSAPIHENHTNHAWISLALLIAFAFVGNCGPANLPWTLVAEVFSNEARIMGCGLLTSFHYISSFTTNVVYLDMVSQFSFAGVYWTFACISIVGLLVIFFLLPETDGRNDVVDHFIIRSDLSNSIKRKSVEYRNNVISGSNI
uniref:Major facilitator superfamily (MFS) profile domain-containing protein n=2 Tax=Photinus pyralis TaxID=7054 RepID=A0A1Y1M322_PHOPY